MQDVRNCFNKKFENEYIVALQEREFYNNRRFNNDLRLLHNDVVLIKEDNVPRMLWRRERIIKFIKGSDDLSRGAEIKLYQQSKGTKTILMRPLQHLVPFEIADSKSSDIVNEEEYISTDITDDNNIENYNIQKRPKRLAAVNSDAIGRVIAENDDEFE